LGANSDYRIVSRFALRNEPFRAENPARKTLLSAFSQILCKYFNILTKKSKHIFRKNVRVSIDKSNICSYNTNQNRRSVNMGREICGVVYLTYKREEQ
jgi:hypothetical protein